MTAIPSGKQKSLLVQIMNELDEFSIEEMSYVLYWLKVKKKSAAATYIDGTVVPNNLTLDDIYAERDAMRKEKIQ